MLELYEQIYLYDAVEMNIVSRCIRVYIDKCSKKIMVERYHISRNCAFYLQRDTQQLYYWTYKNILYSSSVTTTIWSRQRYISKLLYILFSLYTTYITINVRCFWPTYIWAHAIFIWWKINHKPHTNELTFFSTMSIKYYIFVLCSICRYIYMRTGWFLVKMLLTYIGI